jgi:hypothetical protein
MCEMGALLLSYVRQDLGESLPPLISPLVCEPRHCARKRLWAVQDPAVILGGGGAVFGESILSDLPRRNACPQLTQNQVTNADTACASPTNIQRIIRNTSV